MNPKKEPLNKDSWQLKTLEEIALKTVVGYGVTKEQVGTGDWPAIRHKDVHRAKIYIEEGANLVDPKIIRNPRYIEKGDLLIVLISENMYGIGRSCVYTGEQKAILGNDVVSIKHDQNPTYLVYACTSKFVKKQFQNNSKAGKVVHLYKSSFSEIKIPLPPLEVQEKIANYLDKFFELSRELEQALAKMREAVEKQREYYKNLIFNRGIEEGLGWGLETLESIALKTVAGNDVRKDQIGTGDWPAIRYKDIHDSNIYIKQTINLVDPKIIRRAKYIEKGYLLMAKVSENLEDIGKACAYTGEQNAILGGGAIAIKHNHNPAYLAYACSSKFVKKQFQYNSRPGNIVNFPMSSLSKIKVPLPSLEEQQKVVEFLDKLYAATNDRLEEIPKLIKDIQKKYEYHRDQLLQIEEPEGAKA